MMSFESIPRCMSRNFRPDHSAARPACFGTHSLSHTGYRHCLQSSMLQCRSSNSSVLGSSNLFLIIYSKPGCHLCDGLKDKVQAILDKAMFQPSPLSSTSLQIRNILEEPEWESAYGMVIPVMTAIKSGESEEIKIPRAPPLGPQGHHRSGGGTALTTTGKHDGGDGLPFEGRKQALPASPSQVEQAGQDVTASDRTLSVIIRDRGGTLPKEMPSAQERLKAVLTEDRQDAPPPGSQIREGHQVMATVISVTAAKKAIRRREILVAGKVCNTSRVVQPGERLEWMQRVHGGKPLDASQAPANLQVVYEDEHMACIVKPQGMPTTQSGVSGRVDVRQCLPYYLRPSQEPGMLCRPQHVHRLDEATGGLLLVAKTRLGLQGLSSSFEQRQVQKSYRTVVGGRLEGRGYVDIPLDGKPSLTEYRALSQTESGNHGCISTLDLYPHTGRMHQLRRHMALVGHPVLGDPKYTYGYAKRHPDAAILLDTQEAEQAMTPPFGVSSEHPGHQTPRARSQYAFWVSQRMAICNTMVAVRDKSSMRNATDQAQTSESPLDVRQTGIHRLISQRMQEDSLLPSREPHTQSWTHWNPDRHGD
ncbi:hypothetical protein WJX79_002955 [Trebouxia sp. C0005]